MIPRFLLDTHIFVRWVMDSNRLSREQARILREAARHQEPLAISAITLLEIALLGDLRRSRKEVPVRSLFSELEANAGFQIIPLTVEVGVEIAALGNSLLDPGDRTIVATARVKNLRLLTSGERIIASNLVRVVE